MKKTRFLDKNSAIFLLSIGCLMGIYLITFSLFGYCQYASFSFQDMDLAAINQAFWNGMPGRLVTASHVGESALLNNHKWFIAAALLPLYTLFPEPLILLYIQAIALSIGAWAVYLLAREALNPALEMVKD